MPRKPSIDAHGPPSDIWTARPAALLFVVACFALVAELEPGTYGFACRLPSHYEAGMAGTITVTD